MQDLFTKIPVQIPIPLSINEKLQSSLHPIGRDWYMKRMNEKLPPLNKLKLSKKAQKK